VRLALRGRHQLTNAATAIALAETLRARGFDIPRAAISAGLQTAAHPGRLELLSGPPPLLLDGAHNPAGAQSLRAYLDEFIRAPVTLLFGAMADKQLDEIACALFPAAQHIVLTRPTNARAAAPEQLRQLAARHAGDLPTEFIAQPAAALDRARALTPPDGLVCVTGSLYLVGEVRGLLRAQSAS
jgi:dihydrofolate synthase / folylpolyglutamate synthase